jgi:hypothetical protein
VFVWGLVVWGLLVTGGDETVLLEDGAGVLVVCVLGFGGTGFGFSPGSDELPATAVIWTCCVPWLLAAG